MFKAAQETTAVLKDLALGFVVEMICPGFMPHSLGLTLSTKGALRTDNAEGIHKGQPALKATALGTSAETPQSAARSPAEKQQGADSRQLNKTKRIQLIADGLLFRWLL